MTYATVILFSLYGINIYLLFFGLGFFFLIQSFLLKSMIDTFSFDLDTADFEINSVENIEASESSISTIKISENNHINTIENDFGNTNKIPSSEAVQINFDEENSLDSLIDDFDIDDVMNRYNNDKQRSKEQRTPYPKLLSFKILKISFAIFGLSGLVLEHYINNPILCFLVALSFSFATCFSYYFSLKTIADQTMYNIYDPVFEGRKAVVTLPIPKNGFGQIVVLIVGERHQLRAKSINNAKIKGGTMIKILKKTRNTCLVIPIL